MLLYGPGADREKFAAYWVGALGFTGSEEFEAETGKPYETRHRYDESQRLNLEYATWSTSHGQFVVAYLGLDGTYQWNRTHYFDFLRNVKETD